MRPCQPSSHFQSDEKQSGGSCDDADRGLYFVACDHYLSAICVGIYHFVITVWRAKEAESNRVMNKDGE
jgi:hypothetical protein